MVPSSVWPPFNNRMRDAVQAKYQHPSLRKYIDNFTCALCQKYKLSGRQYTVWSPTRERGVRTHPWQYVAVDPMGPWVVKIRDKCYEFNALTYIDMVTN